MLLTTYILNHVDWDILGVINNHLTWLAIRPDAQVFVFGHNVHLETYFFEKGTRIFITSGDMGQELHVTPEKTLTKRIVVT